MNMAKTVVLGVTGGIAAYKACELTSLLVKAGVEVYGILTENAAKFVSPMVFESLTRHEWVVDMFERPSHRDIEHISLAQRADLFLIAPATANFMAKMAAGIADDMLTTTVLATKAPVLVAPAMNVNMWENPVTQRNFADLKGLGVHFVEPAVGRLACGDVGRGKLAPVEEIYEAAMDLLEPRRDLEGLKVLVTAGPTREAIDPVRFIGNHSSGKMGYALAERAKARGASVTLITGPVEIAPPSGVTVVPVTTTEEMLQAARTAFPEADITIKAAAPADFRAKYPRTEKIKKEADRDDFVLELVKNPDIAKTLGEMKKPGQVLVGFAAETGSLFTNARAKVLSKHLDFIVANDVTRAGAGFGTDTNIVTLIDGEGDGVELPLMDKKAVADRVLDEALAVHRRKNG
ncbi:bifunctional phosphopantothenoylcysteine decarboxylase/phosphopantothenate--cysteine ligase CoaBC [Gehongia tenuis]|uniref:Coenzyme A biosynthesis bifunctional protein CoaBC n=1 Tax=Gehongia tenuis TaxID=2763655 RepID=A0A926HKA3_9FIRM|nr:bifunctional phosphopantothenoylcysteine decarboxylase/phosphopantothenate--cysteine ligase CoaBC [Gehongia tenuis]MBC8530762.1 bifunctional phosphopantothenoylcysteine decarboxylase/phosphopantothenate--cysteine ligase CoaBC [Gehongia tenuis]